MNHQKFDTVVVGSGTCAYYAVDTLNKAGQKVAIVDERPFGGTCALRGCQPKKYLVSNAEAKSWQQAGVTTFHGRAVMSGGDVITVGQDRLKARAHRSGHRCLASTF